MENDILTLEEVAQYLRIAERTVYDWAQKGKIPGGKFGTSWRFKRTDIAQWVDEQLDSSTSKEPAVSSLRSILAPEQVLLLHATTKHEAFNALLTTLATVPGIPHPQELQEEIFRREDLLSTGIGRGTGIPHVRLASASKLTMAAGICHTPLPDYISIDGTPVGLIFMIIAPRNSHQAYLQVLAQLSTLVKNGSFYQALHTAPDTETAYGIITSNIH